jgi:hypothetical protein
VEVLDVLEAEDREVVINTKPKAWNFGTVGQGLDVMRLVWPQDRHVFSSQTKDVQHSVPGRPKAEYELGPPKKV